MRFSATTPKISAIWTTISTLEVETKIPISKLVDTASTGKTSARILSGPCKIEKILIATRDGKCKLRITAEAKAPYPRLAQTLFLEIVTKTDVTN